MAYCTASAFAPSAPSAPPAPPMLTTASYDDRESTMTTTMNTTSTSSRMTTCTASGAAPVVQRRWYTCRPCFRNLCVVLRSLVVRPNRGQGGAGNPTTTATTAGPPVILTVPVTRRRCATETGLRSDCPDRIEGDPNSRLRVFCIRPLPARRRGTGAVGPTCRRSFNVLDVPGNKPCQNPTEEALDTTGEEEGRQELTE